ncbi:hypothetical protein K438DRAFT_536507 [Mycena galopus ATCC 62051]|nr:hypothetical protein K438DRAFT_536507 [Mycena galopus ATCC 62051]
MSPQSPPNLSLDLFTKRKRVNLACVNCRKRKVKCTTSDVSPYTPCGRCTKMSLTCTYLSVADQGADMKSSTGGGRKSPNVHHVSGPPPTMTRSWSQFQEHSNSIGAFPGTFKFEKRPPSAKDGLRSSLDIRLAPPPFLYDISPDTPDSNGSASWPLHIQLGQTIPFQLPSSEFNARGCLPEFTVEHRHAPYPSDLYHGFEMYPPVHRHCDNSDMQFRTGG